MIIVKFLNGYVIHNVFVIVVVELKQNNQNNIEQQQTQTISLPPSDLFLKSEKLFNPFSIQSSKNNLKTK